MLVKYAPLLPSKTKPLGCKCVCQIKNALTDTHFRVCYKFSPHHVVLLYFLFITHWLFWKQTLFAGDNLMLWSHQPWLRGHDAGQPCALQADVVPIIIFVNYLNVNLKMVWFAVHCGHGSMDEERACRAWNSPFHFLHTHTHFKIHRHLLTHLHTHPHKQTLTHTHTQTQTHTH